MDHEILMILYIISCHLWLVMTHIMTSAALILERRRENRLVKK
jgi:ABC-type arginine transport system permease subunit